jgi:predicted GNAT family N-acyltransferase
MEVVEFGDLSEAQRAELEGDEVDPFDARASQLVWRAKDRHVGLRDADGRLAACAGLVLAEIEVDASRHMGVVGIGGVIVAARYRGQGLGSRVISEALRRAARLGPELAILFCHRDRSGLYARHRFAEIAPPVLVQQPGGYVPIPQVAMWRALADGVSLPPGRVRVNSLPF